MKYKETIEFLFSQLPAYHRIGKAAYKDDLSNSTAFDNYLGHPHKRYRTIHIAGTNGKGSVSHMIASVLMKAGYKTGLFTSPHIADFRERIRVNGRMIPRQAVTGFIKKHSEFIKTLKPSFFEMTAAMAFEYFADTGVDVAVIEVGLGGRLDSTNIINPVLSVITNIGHDHMDLLGDSLEKVAAEKAGIIKFKVPVVISETQKETEPVFLSKAVETASEVFFADRNYSCTLDDMDYETGVRIYRINDKLSDQRFSGETNLGGDYQAKNLQAVFQALMVLKGIFSITDKDITNGIHDVVASTHFSGRWQIAGRKPLIILDTGHNKEGIEYVIGQIKKIHSTKLHFVLGFVSDKDISSILPLFPPEASYYFTKASVPRALDEKVLMEKAAESGLQGKCYPDVKSAITTARSNASDTDVIFIGGSTFIVADALLFS
jgi:dihydrofolate synthase/folylpolyglutamate synthase